MWRTSVGAIFSLSRPFCPPSFQRALFCRTAWPPVPAAGRCRLISTTATTENKSRSPPNRNDGEDATKIRLSKLLSQHALNLAISRKTANRLIEEGAVTLAGRVVRSPNLMVDPKELGDSGSVVVKVEGKGIRLDEGLWSTNNKKKTVPTVFAVHKLAGEVVTERDPQNRPSMMTRLMQGGVGKTSHPLALKHNLSSRKQQPPPRAMMHLKPIGRLDMPTEGLILVTNDGGYAREMELPRNKVHRVYRARVHGRLTTTKLQRIRAGGVRFEGVRYGPMRVAVEKKGGGGRGRSRPRGGADPDAHRSSASTWVRITSTEGKNRQIRNVFAALGVTVTRLIRVAYGDYSLQTIPPGMAIELPYKPISKQKAKGPIVAPKSNARQQGRRRMDEEDASVRWVSAGYSVR